MILYHASSTNDIKYLEPRISNHNTPLVYFSSKRENVLVYLSNSIEKFCKESNFNYNGIYSKWGPYGFNKDGIMRIEEYYPNALYETYKGVRGYIYTVSDTKNTEKLNDIPFAYISKEKIKTDSIEHIDDAYKAIEEAVKQGKLIVSKYEDLSENKHKWIEETIKEQYEEAKDHPEYRYFLKNKFPFLT